TGTPTEPVSWRTASAVGRSATYCFKLTGFALTGFFAHESHRLAYALGVFSHVAADVLCGLRAVSAGPACSSGQRGAPDFLLGGRALPVFVPAHAYRLLRRTHVLHTSPAAPGPAPSGTLADHGRLSRPSPACRAAHVLASAPA